ncbi:hypothetical protein RI570_20880 [Brucella pseudogrignonensis]|uniref:hypothetical protein n=1 Tax=Brucella pseudogrignonensis TaxID=419475 RepID=UPI0028B9D660|nr:hypothetical protein [Brucella pseudogrignonensis]MDT6942509.1 hypothetical protein [Brucella pseudogrignonensis]
MSNEQEWSGGAGLVSSARSGFHVSKLLEVIVEFGSAQEVVLVSDYECGLVVQGYAAADKVINTGSGQEPHVGCNLAMISIVKEVLRSDQTYEGNDDASDANILCLPVTVMQSKKAALYIRSRGLESVFSIADKRAFELFGITLGRVIDFEHYNSAEVKIAGYDENATVLDKTVSVANPSYIDPSDLAEVAKSIAIEINNSLTAIVAHASAALRWLDQGDSQIYRAKQSLDKIVSAAFSAGGIITVYKSVGKEKCFDADLVDIKKAVGRALEELEHEFLEFDIITDCSLLDEGLVFVEPKQLHQALVNIISATLDSLKASSMTKKLRILGEQRHHEFIVKISDDARPSVRNRSGLGLNAANQLTREIKLAIANTLAHVQGGGLTLSTSDQSERTIELSLPNTKRQRYLYFPK